MIKHSTLIVKHSTIHIHHSTFINTGNNMETHLRKTTKVLFISHEKCRYHLAVYDLQTILKICLLDQLFFLSCSLVYSSNYSYWSTQNLDRLLYSTICALSCSSTPTKWSAHSTAYPWLNKLLQSDFSLI